MKEGDQIGSSRFLFGKVVFRKLRIKLRGLSPQARTIPTVRKLRIDLKMLET
jgi:hypothetical protein